MRGLAGIHVGTTGICDYVAVARQLAESSGAEIRYGARVVRVDRRPDLGVAVRTAGPGGGEVVRGRVLVNCAGLYCDEMARLTGDDPGMRIVPFRGEYFTLARPELVRGLVYPVPDPAFPFLGVHLTRGIDGGVHIGPNAVPALAREGYGWGTVRVRELGATVAWPGTWRIAARHWRYGGGELRRSVSKRAFARAVRRLLPVVSEGIWCLRRRGFGRRRCCGTGRWWMTS